jgi:S-(hydroxymethyl)glutathione dehydrogenase / alcohol dehydrogenase
MKAAVLREFKKPLVIEDVTMDSPGKGEVKIKMAATAICHSDLHLMSGDFPMTPPIIAGHESSGFVEEIGEGVTSVKPGDAVLISTTVSCNKCRACKSGLYHMCDLRRKANFAGHIKSKKGESIATMGMVAGFAEGTIASEEQITLLPKGFSMEKASLLSCGFITGFGAVVNRAQVKPLSSVVVIGTGGVGLSCIQGAACSGAYPIIAVDTLDNKLEAARKFGASHTINAKKEDVVKKVMEITEGWGTEYSFTTVGTNEAIRQAVTMLAKRGTCVLIGIPTAGATFSFSPFEIMDDEKVITACYMGSANMQLDIPKIINLYKAGKINLDDMVTATYPLSRITEAIEAMEKGKALRNVIVF